MLSYLATSAIPFMIIYIITVGIKEKLNVYELFVSGVVEGLKMMYRIFPYILRNTYCSRTFRCNKYFRNNNETISKYFITSWS